MRQNVVIIGSGLGGLGAAALFAKAGHQVTVLEKNGQLGGRAGLLEAQGFRFDAGPSWYLMPDIFEQFFSLLGENVSDHLELVKLSPSYRLFYPDQAQPPIDIRSNRLTDAATFESIEPGAGAQLERYLDTAAYLYDTAVSKLLHKNYTSVGDLLSRDLLMAAPKLKLGSNLHSYIARRFKDPRLQRILEYPSVFLGASPYDTPAFYSLLNHVVFTQGVYYPMGGIYQLTEALVAIGKKHGVQYRTSTQVEAITVDGPKATGVDAGGQRVAADIVISDADPYHTETQLLPDHARDYSDRYWQSRVAAPSALLLYIGVGRQYASLQHHNLLFSNDWQRNFDEIFKQPQFPGDPSLYVCAPSKTDPSVAPAGHENLFVLVPIGAGVEYDDEQLHLYSQHILAAMETHMDLPDLRQHIVYQKAFCVKDFAEQYHSFQGTSLGLAHTLRQTAIFRPRNRSRKLPNLYYVGGNVHPGIGMPTTLISAELAYKHTIGDRSGKPLTHI